MEVNKPSESDAQETPQVDTMSEEEFKEEFSDGIEEESKAGDENVLGNQEEDSQESQGKTDNIFLTKEELERLVGREVKDKNDFEKHYTNLKSFVGKKEEKVEEKPQPKKSQGNEVMEKLNRIEFFGENPEAKKYFDDFIKPMADGKGISLEEAYSQVKPYIQATEAQEKEKEIGVESRNRLEPAMDKKLAALANKAREGDKRAQEEYVRQVINKKAGF